MSTKALAAVAATGQLVFVAAWIAGGLSQEGYSPARQTVSELFSRPADHPWILWIGLAALVPSYLAAAALLWRMLGAGGRPAAALFVVAVPLVLTVLFSPLDCMTNGDSSCTARVDAGEVSSVHSRHNAAAISLQLCLVATPFLVAFALRRRPRAAAALALVALVGLGTVAWVSLSGPGAAAYGIAQRTTFGFVNVWVIAIAAAAVFGAGEGDKVVDP